MERPVMPYTCAEYRKEMILVHLKKQLNRKNLTQEEKADIDLQIKELEASLGLD